MGYEKSISPKGTLLGIVSTHPLGKIVNKEKALFPVNVSLAYRNYYNIEKRKLNNKNIENNSANYFELRTSYTSDALVKNTKSNLNTSMFSVGAVFGIQRAFAERWSYHFNTGLFWVSGTGKDAVVSSFWKKDKNVKSAVWPGVDFGIHYIIH